MPARRIRSRSALVLLAVLAVGAGEARAAVSAQIEVEAILEGRVLLGDSAMPGGTVVLHRVSDVEQGEIDSTRVSNGSFSFRLPGLPNPAVGELYFASVRHQGVMYFGPAITQPIQLDSTYLIQAYDTILAPPEGMNLALEGRIVIFEPQGESWSVMDVFTLHNELDRTIVARPGGRVWEYPLPGTATDVTSEGEMSTDVLAYEDGGIVARGAIPPGERMFMVRYSLPSPEVSIPTVDTTGFFEVLVREPAPPIDITGLTPAGSEEIAGGQYRRYSGEAVALPSVDISLGEEAEPPPVEWVAVILAIVLAAGGVVALRARSARTSAAARTDRRQELLLDVARLDEDYQRVKSPSEEVTREYRARRAALIEQLRKGA
jgi:hypothetical protein